MLQRIFHLERYGIELTRKVAAARQRMDIEVSSSEGQLQAYDKFPYGKPQTDEVARGSGTESMAVRD